MPNTAHAKVGLSQATLLRGAQYVGSFLATFPGLVLALVLAAGWGLRRDRVLVLTAMGLVAAVFGYSALVGGDYMAMGRFLVPALPYFGLLFAAGLAGLARGGVERAGATPPTSGSSIGRPAWRLALTVLACGGSLLPAYGHDLVPAGLAQRLHFRWDRAEPASELEEWRGLVRGADYGVRIGRLLARHTRPGESIVLGALGGQGYYSDLFVYDRYGLVTREVALLPEQTDKRRSAGHSKYVTVDFFLPKRPTYLGAMVARRGRDPQLHPSLAGKVEFLRFPALPADGFPEGTRLILLRGVYGDAGPRDAGKIGSEDESRAGETQD